MEVVEEFGDTKKALTSFFVMLSLIHQMNFQGDKCFARCSDKQSEPDEFNEDNFFNDTVFLNLIFNFII